MGRLTLRWHWLRIRAALGITRDQLSVAHAYWVGRYGVVDTERAIAWAKRAARARSPEAHMLLGAMYTVRNAPGDRKAVFEGYKQAASEGYAPAMQSVAWCLEQGFGTERNLPEAFKWYRAAADSGEVRSQIAVARMLLDGTAGVSEPALAWRYALMAKEAGADEADSIMRALLLSAPK